jgi:NitT/TauT family transport system substrate-binding protein
VPAAILPAQGGLGLVRRLLTFSGGRITGKNKVDGHVMAIKWFASGLAALLLVGLGQPAGAQTDIKFTLDWKFQGPTAQFIVAQEKGYFADEGLDVTIDSGNGSAGAVTRVASGAYQMGFADINALVEFMAANPGQPIKSVMMLYDAPPFGVYALKSSGIKEPKDLVGRTLGAPVFDASYKLFPAFAHQVGIDPAAVPRVNMDPPLREAMLVRGDVDAITGHDFSSMLDLMAKGVAKDDIVAMLYADYGMDFYGSSIIASGAFIDQHPDAVAGFNRAVAKGLKDVIADPAAAVALVADYDPLIDQKLEVERLNMAIERNILTPHVKQAGFGDVDPARMGRAIDQLAEALNLETKPAVADIWTDAFLPDPKLRQLVTE